MASIPKIIGVILCSVVLCLSLSNAAQAGNMKQNPCADRKGGEPNLLPCDAESMQGIETIKGQVVRVDGDNYLVERFDGKEVSLHVDKTTKVSGHIGRGDRIEAKVSETNDEQKHVVSLRPLE